MSIMNCSLLSLGCVFGFTPREDQATLTALRALKIAQRRLRPEVRSKLMSISSARSDAALAPEAWRFVFQDMATSGNCRVVTVAAKTSSEHPDTVEAFSTFKAEDINALHPIPQNKLLIDSDQALERARTVSKLKGVRAAEYRLVHLRNAQESIWFLQFLAEGGETVVRFRIGAKNGAVELVNDPSSKG